MYVTTGQVWYSILKQVCKYFCDKTYRPIELNKDYKWPPVSSGQDLLSVCDKNIFPHLLEAFGLRRNGRFIFIK